MTVAVRLRFRPWLRLLCRLRLRRAIGWAAAFALGDGGLAGRWALTSNPETGVR
jgi:hypothetical protein